MKPFNILPLAGLVLGVLASAAAAQSPGDPSVSPNAPASPSGVHVSRNGELTSAVPSVPVRASKLFGTDVKDSRGDKVGDLKDIVSADGGKVVAVVKRTTDGAFIGLPLRDLTPMVATKDATEDNAKLAIKEFDTRTDVATIMTAPFVSDLKTIDRTWVGRVCDHFDTGNDGGGRNEPAPGMSRGGDAPSGEDPAAATEPSRTAVPAHVLCADKLIGKALRNGKGEEVGKVEDVAVNVVDAKVAYVIVGSGGMLGVGARYHGVPLHSVSVDADGNAVVVQLDKATLERSPGFDLDHLPAAPDLELSAAESDGMGSVAQQPAGR